MDFENEFTSLNPRTKDVEDFPLYIGIHEMRNALIP